MEGFQEPDVGFEVILCHSYTKIIIPSAKKWLNVESFSRLIAKNLVTITKL